MPGEVFRGSGLSGGWKRKISTCGSPEEAEPEAGELKEVEVDMLEEKEEREQMPEEEVEKEIKAGDIWEKMVEEMQDVGVTNLTFVEPIASRRRWPSGTSRRARRH